MAEIAMKWTKLLRTGALGVKFMGIDLSTIMFNVEGGQKLLEVHKTTFQFFLFLLISSVPLNSWRISIFIFLNS